MRYNQTMTNPWEEIDLKAYEEHMSLDSVKQFQTMNLIMKDQFESYPADTAMVLGIAGGNGLEHVRTDKYRKVYGVDINKEYLQAVSERCKDLSGVLECLQIDLINEYERLPEADLLIANLLIEYIGYEAFQKAVIQTKAEYVSCVIQINTDDKNWVSDSPYLHAFDRLDEVHHQMEEQELTKAMQEIGYHQTKAENHPLPNGKALVRLDFVRKKIVKANPEDLKEILDLQYLAYQSEAALFGNKDIPPLKQTLEEVEDEYRQGIILKMTDEGNIIGSVRAHEKDGTVYIGKLMVHPDHRRKGYGRMLLAEIEQYFPDKRYELFTSTRSKDNIRLYETLGYSQFDCRKVDDELQFVYLEKQ